MYATASSRAGRTPRYPSVPASAAPTTPFTSATRDGSRTLLLRAYGGATGTQCSGGCSRIRVERTSASSSSHMMAGGSSGTSSDSLKGAHGALSLPSAWPGAPGRARPAAACAHGAAAACLIAEATALAVPGGKTSEASPPKGSLGERPTCPRFTGCRPAACMGCAALSLRTPLGLAATPCRADTARTAAASAARSAAGAAARSGRKGNQRPPRCAATEPGAWPHASSPSPHASARPLLLAQVRTGGSGSVWLLQGARAAPRHQRCSQRQRLVCAADAPAPAASGVQG